MNDHIKVGARLRIRGPRYDAIYVVEHRAGDYFSAHRSPRPGVRRRDGFGNSISELLAEGHTIAPLRCISDPNGPGVCSTHGKGFAAGGRCVDGRIGR